MALSATLAGPAALDLFAGPGVDLRQQTADEVEQERKRRLREQRAARLSGTSAAASGLFGDIGVMRGY